ncbi:VOC family protein [Candidatus Parcubacteria bacterium]|uniref:VOC family protein n=1 Tax=Candidatus Kaiserbacteria bacterium CG10_big_fil_rev_8_21_14_0_10_47_16 TaxID=1974608 RepID=A0A2H0UEH6_9BACT|nr:VOC family protein [Candidatus Parcubacteria bacterium]PIR84802.1 MAG: VOC family protein [Candidatus Kaiserbacteria bacterium CG10_big_fil_rev_8_21_14_0_10_47_16]
MQKIVPCLWFDTQAEKAVDLYLSLFPDSEILNTLHYDKASAEVSGQPEGSILTIEYYLAGYTFLAMNGGPNFTFTPAISLSVQCETEEEIDKLYAALSEGGGVLMPLQKYDFSPRFAWVADKYGVSWQLNLAPDYSTVKQKIEPFIMFTGENFRKAKEAMGFYTSLFENSRITSLYPSEENGKEIVMHATFELNGEELMASDSGIDHKFTITPAISLIVNCTTQEEIDTLWNALSAVPEAEQCGWLQDTYGVSWQIVPTVLNTLLQDTDPQKRERVMKAMLAMKKLNIAELETAHRA